MLLESRNSASSTGSNSSLIVSYTSALGGQGGELFFLFGKSKSCMKTYVDFKL